MSVWGRESRRSEPEGQLATGKLVTGKDIKICAWIHQGIRGSAGHV